MYRQVFHVLLKNKRQTEKPNGPQISMLPEFPPTLQFSHRDALNKKWPLLWTVGSDELPLWIKSVWAAGSKASEFLVCKNYYGHAWPMWRCLKKKERERKKTIENESVFELRIKGPVQDPLPPNMYPVVFFCCEDLTRGVGPEPSISSSYFSMLFLLWASLGKSGKQWTMKQSDSKYFWRQTAPL